MNYIVYFFVFVILFTYSCSGNIRFPENVVYPDAVFVFGDSYVDTGNNNEVKTIVKCNFPPYGKDFPGALPTGRFSNGKMLPDFLAEIIGIKDLIPAYLDPNLKSSDLVTGVSFASAASGYDPLTSELLSVISLPNQLELFKEYIEKLKGIVGEEKLQQILTSAIYLLSSGTNDFTIVFNKGIRKIQYNVDSYADILVDSASNFIKDLYKLGARRVAVLSMPPFGCLPSERTLTGGFNRTCQEKSNNEAKLANGKLSSKLDSLAKSLLDSRLVYIDFYFSLLDFIQKPQNYGFEVVDRGCCGTGKIEASILCNKYSFTCSNDSAYVFWDSVHLTETAYKIIAYEIIAPSIDKFF